MESLKQLTIGVFHHDCYCSLLTSRYPELELAQRSSIVYLDKKPDHVDYEVVWRVRAPSNSYLEKALGYLRGLPRTREMKVLSRSPCEVDLLHNSRAANSSYDAVLKNHGIYSSPVRVVGGLEIHTVITREPDSIEKMIKEFDSVGQSKVLRIGDYRPDADNGFNLTKKQVDALRIALDNGYYDWPKRVTLEELAMIERISRRSMQERLRRAERKVLPKIIERLLQGAS